MQTINAKLRHTAKWRTFIKDNLQNGTPFQSIVAYMLQNGFEPTYAMTAVQIFLDEMNSEYKYETPIFSHAGGWVRSNY